MPGLYNDAIELLKKLISAPSYSGQEIEAANVVQKFIESKGLMPNRKGNNVWLRSSNFKEGRYTVLLNSHLDTVKPSASYTFNPFNPIEKDGKLFGLGSNDAGASLVSMLMAFIELNQIDLPYNIIFAATAEEENSGRGGIESLFEDLGKIDLGIVGEPSQMKMAVAEKCLMVIDCVVHGTAGHAARYDNDNAIYRALPDIEWFKNFQFEKESELLGSVKLTITQINAGYQHNVVPDKCTFVVDVRTNEHYTNQQVCDIIRDHVHCEVRPRSFRLNSSIIPIDHPIIQKGLSIGLSYYGSPTTSDQAVMDFTTFKIGPGDSARSHTADEFIYCKEIENGIDVYIKLLKDMKFD